MTISDLNRLMNASDFRENTFKNEKQDNKAKEKPRSNTTNVTLSQFVFLLWVVREWECVSVRDIPFRLTLPASLL